eukprot:m.260737 g.260737  ORF g.260737 m.260737 type:complete len:207 (+) comp19681_c0_seq33:444-1064(+)
MNESHKLRECERQLHKAEHRVEVLVSENMQLQMRIDDLQIVGTARGTTFDTAKSVGTGVLGAPTVVGTATGVPFRSILGAGSSAAAPPMRVAAHPSPKTDNISAVDGVNADEGADENTCDADSMSETPRVPERGNTRSSKVSFAATCHEPEADSDVRPESPARSNIDGYDIETATGVDGRIGEQTNLIHALSIACSEHCVVRALGA